MDRILIALMFTSVALAAEECIKDKFIECYECDNWRDYRCGDPFNYTFDPETEPTTLQCKGCCVKMVRHFGEPHEYIRRTCTTKLEINLFMVDHVCMLEGGGSGHMCFCEEDKCNAAPPYFNPAYILTAAYVLWHAWCMIWR